MKRDELQHYGELLADVKSRIRQAQTRAILTVNAELVHLYWDIGCLIAKRQREEGWGAGVIPRLARDLHNELPEMKGFSERNITLMVQFSREYPNAFPTTPPIAQPAVAQLPAPHMGRLPVAQIPWAHNVLCNVVSDRLRHETDGPTIGLILCQTKDNVLAEYSLSGIDKPIGISSYQLTRTLPESLQSALPTVDQIEAELGRTLGHDE